MDKSKIDIPIVSATKVPEIDLYVMEIKLSVENVETLGDATKERRAEFQGYASKEVLEAALDMMRSVVADDSVD